MEIMPSWLRTIANANPLTYLVDLLRALIIVGGHSAYGLACDYGIQVAVLVGLVLIAARLYPHVAV